jgi:hypothetical protein
MNSCAESGKVNDLVAGLSAVFCFRILQLYKKTVNDYATIFSTYS